MNVYELKVQKEWWENPERFYITEQGVFAVVNRGKDAEKLERLSEPLCYSWNMAGGDVYLNTLSGKALFDFKEALREYHEKKNLEIRQSSR